MAARTDDVIPRASQILQDVANVRWTTDELEEWCRDAVRRIVLARPDAYSVTRSFALKAGSTLQSVGNVASDDNQSFMAGGPAIRLLRVVRNIGSGRPIREASRVTLDSEISDWHKPVPMSSWADVEHYVFDNMSPYTFYVYPCPPAGLATHMIEIVHAALPIMAGSNLGLHDVYVNPILDWVLYRALSKDAEYAGNSARAAGHLEAFVQALHLTGVSEFTAASPGMASPLPASPGRGGG